MSVDNARIAKNTAYLYVRMLFVLGANFFVFSANPKTPDGFNTFIFRRSIERTVSKLSWLPTIDCRGNPLPGGIALGDKRVRYSPDDKRKTVAP